MINPGDCVFELNIVYMYRVYRVPSFMFPNLGSGLM